MKSISLFLIISLVCSCSNWPSRQTASKKIYYERREIFNEFQFPVDQTKVKVAFFDADSTLRVSRSGIVTANHIEDVYILPCVAERLASLAADGYLIAVISNQGGVPKMPHTIASGALLTTVQLIYELGGAVHYFDYAAKDDDENLSLSEIEKNRKPGLAMAWRLEEKLKNLGFELDKESSFMVGDSAYKIGIDKKPDGSPGTHFSNADRGFALNYFSDFKNSLVPYHFEEANVFFGWDKNGIDVFQTEENTGITGIEMAKNYLQKFKENACPPSNSKLH